MVALHFKGLRWLVYQDNELNDEERIVTDDVPSPRYGLRQVGRLELKMTKISKSEKKFESG